MKMRHLGPGKKDGLLFSFCDLGGRIDSAFERAVKGEKASHNR